MSQEPLEANEADTAEQQFDVVDENEQRSPVPPVVTPVEANPADAVEQRIAVPLDEEDYR
jgi:hypothetical protein